jgi:hypothetical protein
MHEPILLEHVNDLATDLSLLLLLSAFLWRVRRDQDAFSTVYWMC